MMARFAAEGLVDTPTKPARRSLAFDRFLKKNAGGGVDTEPIAAAFAPSIPHPSYVEFLAKVGPWEFEDPENEGCTIRLVPPDEIDGVSYRMGQVGDDDDESRAIDGILFAVDISGDCFCFDVAQPGPEYPVVHYRHEYDMFEGYAAGFAEFVERLLG